MDTFGGGVVRGDPPGGSPPRTRCGPVGERGRRHSAAAEHADRRASAPMRPSA
ncbi:hypothetical protein [Amycolatopsis plumensis]|uniref:hypothetical protein n=1 Tax=Amycolatopsis plumensis TaxID=236508 RepID=UPI0036081C61